MATPALGTSNSLYWLTLGLSPGMGPPRGRKLAELFEKVGEIFHASLTELEALNLQEQSAQHIALGKSLEMAHEEFAKALAGGIQIVSRDDSGWPARLGEIYDPPLVLYVRGGADALARPGIAIVGTRHPTPYGIGIAERPARGLAARGTGIISGMG